MKKFLLLIACVFASIGSVGAMELNEEINLLKSPYSDEELEEMAKENDNFEIARNEIYTITSYTTNSLGQIVEENTMLATEEEANLVKEDDSLYVGTNGQLQQKSPISTFALPRADEIRTESKKIVIIYAYSEGTYKAGVETTWLKLPKVRVYDVTAMRWTSDATVSYFKGSQVSDEKTTLYDITSSNIKKADRGFGCSMNLHNNTSSSLELKYMIESTKPFGDVYGTYQHATSSKVTLAISKSYTFSSNGLGGVIYYSNKTYRSYYDDTPGLSLIGS